MDTTMNAPPFTIRFIPREEELICYYLKNRILGNTIPELDYYGLIMLGDLYGDNATPWELFKRDDPAVPWHGVVDSLGKVHPDRVIYVFAKLSNVGKTEKSEGKQKNQVAGCGTWHGNTPLKPVRRANGKTIGYKRTFTFRTPEEVVTDGQWTMIEYSIDGAANGMDIPAGMNLDDYVLCRIKRDDSKSSQGGKIVNRKRKILLAGADDHQKKLRKTKEKEEEEIISIIETPTLDDGASTSGCVPLLMDAADAGDHYQGSSDVSIETWDEYALQDSTNPDLCLDDMEAFIQELDNWPHPTESLNS